MAAVSNHCRRRVVVTGMGAVSPLGNSLVESWSRLLVATSADPTRSPGGRITSSGVTSLEEALVEHQGLSPEQLDREWRLAKALPCQVAAPVRNLDSAAAGAASGTSSDRKTARFVQMALAAGAEAMHQAGLIDWLEAHDGGGSVADPAGSPRDRFGVCVGSGMSGVREIVDAWHATNANVPADGDGAATVGIRKLSPHFIPKVLTNSASGRLSLRYGLRGPNLAPSTACAAGSHAIGDALRAIQYGTADLMLAGGAEASIEPLGMAGFCRLRALSTGFNATPESASRPFDVRRDGFVMGEGAAVLVMEELQHAKDRGATILAEVSGYGLGGDAFHVTAPDEGGRGAERAMVMALADAAATLVSPFRVGYVNAHATSTPKGDEIEASVIDRVLRRHEASTATTTADDWDSATAPYVSSTKGATGHLLGAAGALEAAFTVMSLVDQTMPPTLNLDPLGGISEEGGNCHLHFKHVTRAPIDLKSLSDGTRPSARSVLKVAMSNSFGFGGTNASLVFSAYKDGNDNEDGND